MEGAAVYVVTTYRREITSLITDTVAGWDAEHTSRKIEAHIGRDLQFIRINGTVVGVAGRAADLHGVAGAGGVRGLVEGTRVAFARGPLEDRPTGREPFRDHSPGRYRPYRDDEHPRPTRPASLVPLALDDRHRTRHRVDPRRPGGHGRRQHREPALGAGQRPAHLLRTGHRDRGGAVCGRGVPGGAVLGAADGQVGPQEAVHDHAGGVSRRHRADVGRLRRRGGSSCSAS